MALSAVGLGVLATNSVVSASLVDATVSTAILSVTGKTVTGPIAAIAEGALQSMTISKIKITAVALFVVTTAVIGGFFVSANAHTPTRTSHSLVALTPLPDEPKAELAKDVKVELNAKGELVVGERQLSKLEEIEDHLTKLFKQDARANENTILVVRIPGTAESAVVRPFLYLANRVGFARIRLITADRTVRQSLPIEYAPEPDRSPDVTVIAKAIKVGDDAGGLEGIYVRTPSGEKQAEANVKDLPALEAYLRQVQSKVIDKKHLSLDVDASLKVADFSRILDACRSSGFRHFHLVYPSSNDLADLNAETKLQRAAIGVRFQTRSTIRLVRT